MQAARRLLVATALLVVAAPASADVELGMTVEGPRGPFASAAYASPGAVKVTSIQLDLGPSKPGPLVAPPPVVVTRPIDTLSWQFLAAAGTGDLLRVVITVTRARSDSEVRHRRVVTLTNARVLSVHAAMEATDDATRPGIGVETVAFTYERIEVEDDGLKVFASGA